MPSTSSDTGAFGDTTEALPNYQAQRASDIAPGAASLTIPFNIEITSENPMHASVGYVGVEAMLL